MRTLLILVAVVSLSLASLGNAGEPAFSNAQHAQNIDSWTLETLKAQVYADDVKVQYEGGKIKTISFMAPRRGFHGPECMSLIYGVQRGPNADTSSDIDDYSSETVWVDHQTGCTITQYVRPDESWKFAVTKDDGSIVLRAHYVEGKSSRDQLILEIP